MIVFLNGQFVPEAQATVSVFDRSFLYGDGLFETMRLTRGRPFRWANHLERLRAGCELLGIQLPGSEEDFAGWIAELVIRNQMPESLLRLTVSRGVGARGYSPRAATAPTLVMSLHPLPKINATADNSVCPYAQWKLQTTSITLPADSKLARVKTANKLPQILARAEADAAGADEALLKSTDGFVIEGSTANLFWIENDAVCTAPADSGILPGVTRAVVLELCRDLNLTVREQRITPVALSKVQGAFLTLSSLGVVEAIALNGVPLARSPLTPRLVAAYNAVVARD